MEIEAPSDRLLPLRKMLDQEWLVWPLFKLSLSGILHRVSSQHFFKEETKMVLESINTI